MRRLRPVHHLQRNRQRRPVLQLRRNRRLSAMPGHGQTRTRTRPVGTRGFSRVLLHYVPLAILSPAILLLDKIQYPDAAHLEVAADMGDRLLDNDGYLPIQCGGSLGRMRLDRAEAQTGREWRIRYRLPEAP